MACGWQLGEWPVIIANALTLLLAASILLTKIAVERKRRRAPGTPRRSG